MRFTVGINELETKDDESIVKRLNAFRNIALATLAVVQHKLLSSKETALLLLVLCWSVVIFGFDFVI